MMCATSKYQILTTLHSFAQLVNLASTSFAPSFEKYHSLANTTSFSRPVQTSSPVGLKVVIVLSPRDGREARVGCEDSDEALILEIESEAVEDHASRVL